MAGNAEHFFEAVRDSTPGAEHCTISRSTYSAISVAIDKINERDDLVMPDDPEKILDWLREHELFSLSKLTYFLMSPEDRAKAVQDAVDEIEKKVCFSCSFCP